MFRSRFASLFWLSTLSSVACDEPSRTDARVDAGVEDAATSGSPEAQVARTLSPFRKLPERSFRGQVFEGDASLASDPCVLHDGAQWRMVYTCVAGAELGGLCQVTSPDGVSWQPVASIDPFIEGLIVAGRPGSWDENVETCALVREPDGLSVIYAGYRNLDADGGRPPAALGRLLSQDGVHFTRDERSPFLASTPGGLDGDDLFSPTAVPGSSLSLIYVGWCVAGYHDGLPCNEGDAVQLLAATRANDGSWQKRPAPVLSPQPGSSWLRDGVAEPELAQGPDGRYYLFFTGSLAEGVPRSTGVAIGDDPFGPWQVLPDPVLIAEPGGADACGAFAPSVVVEHGAVRMWYLALDDCDGTCPSCKHEECGCAPRFSIGYAEASFGP